MNSRILKECKKHGLTKYRLEDKKACKYRCVKCASEAVQKRRDKLKQLAVDYKGGCCSVCGYNKCIGALEFHHTDPEKKDFSISSEGYTRSFESVKLELDKCICVCANCHREIHTHLHKESKSVHIL